MDLSSELISQFAKITNDDKKEKTESTVYGTTVELDGRIYVKLDGSDRLTPVETTTAVTGDERVMVTIKDHSATITGNISSPAARDNDVKDLNNKIDEFDTVIADKVKAETAEIETAIITKLDGKYATFEGLDAKYASITKLEAAEGDIDNLQADNVEINKKLIARDAEIDQLKANSLTVEVADAKYASIDDLEATNGKFNNLESTYGEFVDLTTDKFEAIEGSIADLDVENLNAKYANIDFSNIGKAAMENFYANSGLIQNVIVGDQTITGELVGVTIRGDRIIGGSIVADKLVIKGDDGIYYKLNAEGGATPDQLATEEYQNGLHGSNIIANSITAEKIKVDDLVAFDATIGNFNIGDNSIYSGTKASVDNTTRGIYMDSDGQLNFGDSNNYLKFYKDQNGNYKLDISASSLKFGAGGQSVEEAITDIRSTNSASGRLITLTDSSDGGLIDLKIYGKTIQNGTPTPDAPVPLVNVGDGGSFEVGIYGKNLLNIPTTTLSNGYLFNKLPIFLKKDVTYTFSFMSSGSGSTQFKSFDAQGEAIINALFNITNGSNSYAFTPTEDVYSILYYVNITNVTLSEIQLEANPQVTEYEPCNKQSLAVNDTMCGLGGITDEKDYTTGKTIKRFHSRTFNGSEEWQALSNGRVAFVSDTDYAPNINTSEDLYKPANAICNITSVVSWADTVNVANCFAMGSAASRYIGFRIQGYTESVDTWKSYLASNPVTVVYELKTPIETTLTEEELEAYRAIHTNNPITNIFADGSPEIYVEYFTNTKEGQALAKNAASIQVESDKISSRVTAAQNDADDNAQRITQAESNITQLADSLEFSVTDGSGESLMTQTPTGWTFSMGAFEDALNNLLAHVKIGTYGGKPCLELCVDDSTQRLLLTNETIRLMNDDVAAAYMSGNNMVIKNAVVNDMLSLGHEGDDGGNYNMVIQADGTLSILWEESDGWY